MPNALSYATILWIFKLSFSQNPDADILRKYLSKNYPNGDYHSAYEAGFCRFSPHRELINQGINNIVINPADVPTTDKERKQKEDKRDFGDLDEEKSMKEEDLLASLMEEMEDFDMWFTEA